MTVERAWFVEVPPDLQVNQPVEECPNGCRKLARRGISQVPVVLASLHKLLQCPQAVVGGGFDRRGWISHRRWPEHE